MDQVLFWMIIVFVSGGYLLSLILELLNIRNQRESLPEEMKEIYDEERYKKSQQYEKEKTRLSLITGTLTTIITLCLLIFGGFALLDSWVAGITVHPVWSALLFFGVLFIVSDLLGIPFGIYHTFVLEEKYGFNKTTWKIYLLDKLKGYILTVIVGGGILALIIKLYYWSGELFWLYGWIGITLFSLFITLFYTSILVPIFNKLKPLEAGELREAIESYSEKVGFSVKNIMVMDGSKRSTKSNAYFSGIGPRKTIVLFDTLIEKHTTEELVAVLAHEVGHYKKKHVLQGFIAGTLQTGIIFYLLGWLVGKPELAESLGVNAGSFHIGLLAFGLLYSPVSTVTGILMNMVSRKNEFEADKFAGTTFNSLALQSALKKLSSDNLSNLEPHPAYVFVNYSHPPVLQRLKALAKIQ